jgi:hypothetical protein
MNYGLMVTCARIPRKKLSDEADKIVRNPDVGSEETNEAKNDL